MHIVIRIRALQAFVLATRHEVISATISSTDGILGIFYFILLDYISHLTLIWDIQKKKQ